MKGVCILGATGSIGMSTLEVLARHRERFRVVALTANRDAARLADQALAWQPSYAVLADERAVPELEARLAAGGGKGIRVLAGPQALEHVASLDEVDTVMAAIVGAAGLLPTLAAARSGKRVLLANKESLVMAGDLLLEAVRSSAAELLPIDSEHNAIFQCMPRHDGEALDALGVRRILLTASGGPFRGYAAEQLRAVSPEQACAHPNWDMGRKISVDSATLMNKGLEVIEACWLFATGPERVTVVVHPQSIIHSMVEYSDGSVLAQLGNPDMRTPIAHALAWPERIESGVAALDLVSRGQLAFEDPDLESFPCLRLGFEAAGSGGTATVVLNAANEVAVAGFLERRIRFTDIAAIVEATLQEHDWQRVDSLDRVLTADAWARRRAGDHVRKRAADV